MNGPRSILFALSVLGLVVFSSTFFSIYKEVERNCLRVKKEYQNNCVDSLIKLIQADNKTFRERNSAIWAIGQIADKKALPFLYELDQSLTAQEKCRYDQFLCKYEIQKAIKWCEKGNIASWMYGNIKK